MHLPPPLAPFHARCDARVSLGSPSLCRHRLPRRPHLPVLLHPPAASSGDGVNQAVLPCRREQGHLQETQHRGSYNSVASNPMGG
ncbi:unnamed protein product [Urochloa humidicola]